MRIGKLQKKIWIYAKRWLHKPFEPVFRYFTDRADLRGLIARTKVTADFTAPYRKRENGDGDCCEGNRMGSSSFCPDRAWRAAFGNGLCFFPAIYNIVTDIESTVTGTECIEIGIAVIAGADDIDILCFFTGREPAWAGTISIAPFIFHKAGNEIFGKLSIRIQMVTAFFCLFLQDRVGRFDILRLNLDKWHLPELLSYFLLAEPHNTLLVIDDKGRKRA